MSDDRHSIKEVQKLPDEEYIKWPAPASQPKSEIELGMLQMQILWLLSRKSTHGYDMMKALSILKGTSITQGTLYPTLKRLEELELIKRDEKDRRIIYYITAKGKRTMNESCLEFVKTFYGIFHDFACQSCSFYDEHHKGGKKE